MKTPNDSNSHDNQGAGLAPVVPFELPPGAAPTARATPAGSDPAEARAAEMLAALGVFAAPAPVTLPAAAELAKLSREGIAKLFPAEPAIREAAGFAFRPANRAAKLPKTTPIAIGQKIYWGMYGSRAGIVTVIEGAQKPHTVREMGGGAMVTGGNATFGEIFEDGSGGGRAHTPESIIRGVQWQIFDEIAGPHAIALAERVHAEIAAWRGEKERIKTEARKARHDAAIAEFSGALETFAAYKAANGKAIYGSQLGARNIRKQLKGAFPGIKFSVTSDHNSIDISWEMGPSEAAVKAFTDRYQDGHFNGMEDIHEHDAENVWPDIFGGCDHVNEHRKISAEAIDVVIAGLLALHGEPADAAAVAAARERPFTPTSPHYETHRGIAGRIIGRESFAPGVVVVGVKRRQGVHAGKFEDFYDLIVGAPGGGGSEDKETTRPGDKETPPEQAGIEISENTEKGGVEIRFAAKPAASVLDRLKGHGWRWSSFSRCWWQKKRPGVLEFAQAIAGGA